MRHQLIKRKKMEVKKTTAQIQLVKGEFTPSQASEVVIPLISYKINYHKLDGIEKWEKNHKTDQEPIKIRIDELKNEKKKAEAFFSEMEKEGKTLKIDGILNITIID